MLDRYEIPELIVGSRFADRYEILSVVGRGSMGIVYRARHDLMGRTVAIKTLRGTLQSDDRSLKRFEREARAASRMDHPNLIAVHNFDLTDARQPYMVMEFVNGHTLYDVLKKEKRISPDRAVRIFTQVCDALHHAHVAGVIHRDIKPANIMVLDRPDEPDFVKVFDLGIAKIGFIDQKDAEPLTGTGEVCGSPVYLSPEQCTHGKLDHRSDIYSLGVVMYELLTGIPPLMGETVYDTIYMHVHSVAAPFKEVLHDVWIPPKLERVVMKALEKDPNDRQQTMLDLKAELFAAVQKGDPSVKVQPPDVRRNSPTDAVPVLRDTSVPPTPYATPAVPLPRVPERPLASSNPVAPYLISNDGGAQTVLSKDRPSTSGVRPESNITKWLHGTPLEPLSRSSPTKAALLAGSVSALITVCLVFACAYIWMMFGPASNLATVDTTGDGKSGAAHDSSSHTRSASSATPQHAPKDTSEKASGRLTALTGSGKVDAAAASSAKNQSHAKGAISKNQTTKTASIGKTNPDTADSHNLAAANSSKSKSPAKADSNESSSKPVRTTSGAVGGNFWSAFLPGGQEQQPEPKAAKTPPSRNQRKSKGTAIGTIAQPQRANNTVATEPPRSGGEPGNTREDETARPPIDNSPPPQPAQLSPQAIELNMQGVSQLNANNPAAAIDLFQQAVNISPTYVKAQRNLAAAHFNYANQLATRGEGGALNHYSQSVNLFNKVDGSGGARTKQAMTALKEYQERSGGQ